MENAGDMISTTWSCLSVGNMKKHPIKKRNMMMMMLMNLLKLMRRKRKQLLVLWKHFKKELAKMDNHNYQTRLTDGQIVHFVPKVGQFKVLFKICGSG